MKLPIRLLLVNLTCLFLWAASGCTGPIIKQADFRRDPRGVRRGAMLGPFSGRVVDADSDKAVEGALVWCSWTFHRGVGSPAPLATRVIAARTGPDGNYRIGRPQSLPTGASARLSAVSLVIYKRGYVAYRHDWRFGQRYLQRRDFAQLYNVVRLSRWSSDLSHARHLLFMGGSDALRREAAAELEMAARELDQAKGTAPSKPSMHAASRSLRRTLAERLLDSDAVRAVTGFAGILRGGPLERTGDATDSWHLRAVDRPERYDLALRLWRVSSAQQQRKLAELGKSLPQHKAWPALGPGAFIVRQGDIFGVAFAEPGRDLVVLITCGSGQCTSEDKVAELAGRIRQRIEQQVHAKDRQKGKPQ